MEIRLDETVTPMTAYVSGELGSESVDDFTERLHSYVTGDGACLIVDLSGISAIDSRGLSALIDLATRARLGGGQVMLAKPAPFVAEVLRVTHLDHWFDISESTEQARAKVAKPSGTHAYGG